MKLFLFSRQQILIWTSRCLPPRPSLSLITAAPRPNFFTPPPHAPIYSEFPKSPTQPLPRAVIFLQNRFRSQKRCSCQLGSSQSDFRTRCGTVRTRQLVESGLAKSSHVPVTFSWILCFCVRPCGCRAMKVARASAGRPIRALFGIIHLVRGIQRPRNPF